MRSLCIFFFNDTATTEIYTLSLHDALPIWEITPGRLPRRARELGHHPSSGRPVRSGAGPRRGGHSSAHPRPPRLGTRDRKSTRLNSSHANISYAVFCLKKKKIL